MSFTYGNVGVISIDATAAGTLTDISEYVSSVNPQGEREEATLNRLGGNPAARLVGPVATTVDIEGWFDPVVDAIFSEAMFEATPVTRSVEYSPQGEGTGLPTFTGEAYILNYEVDTSAEDAASWTASLLIDGAWTRTLGV